MTAPKEKSGCIFCVARDTHDPADAEARLLLMRTDSVLVMLNRYPYSNGHLMLAPAVHVARLFDSEGAVLDQLIRLAAESQRLLSEEYHPDGFNVGMNFGEVAGAGVADHYHMHVVPRWGGDSNFMTVTAETRLVPEELQTTWRRLRPRFDALAESLKER